MNTDRIKEIQLATAHPESGSVYTALLKVWNETTQEQLRIAAVSGQLEAIRKDFCLWYYAQSQPLDAHKVIDWFASNLR
jgi:tRNA(Ile)-lysidine synthase TilS/MesJ